ncbi:MAG: phosphoenolpyruvate carboxykinase [Bacteriovoracaceae bacterium]|nr:phosphoenolpyruvate carboxykinase [Bacteriovoracaceae bacterium]
MIEETLKLAQGSLSREGALLVETGKFTGRAVKERFIPDRAEIHNTIAWNTANQAISPEFAVEFFSKLEKKLGSLKTYESNAFVASFPIQVKSTSAWHIAFCENMFRRKAGPVGLSKDHSAVKQIKIFHDPYGKLSDLGLKHTSETIIILDPLEMKVGIVGTAYAGEIKKAAFTLCNYAFPEVGVLPMHASANCLEDGSQSCVLFGLSGTGKTTLSASADRFLIGDDEIIWSDNGLSNLEGGCYAKLIDLTLEREPEIYRAVNRSGAIMENVYYDKATRVPDFSNRSLTENSRGSYPIEFIQKIYRQSAEAHAPKTIVFLMADAFGVMPAVAKLDAWQTQYYFISGYTAKVAGTELGVKEPQAAFSTCFGAPFMPRHSAEYAELLAQNVKKSGASVWLLNTGWTQGGYGKGERFPLAVSRRILSAIQSGELAKQPTQKHPVFGFEVPKACAGVDPKYLTIPGGEGVSTLSQKFKANSEQFKSKLDSRILDLGGPGSGQ